MSCPRQPAKRESHYRVVGARSVAAARSRMLSSPVRLRSTGNPKQLIKQKPAMKMNLITRPSTMAATFLLLSAAFGVNQLAAADKTWNGLGTNNNWTTSSNWNAAVAAGDSLFFAGTTRLTPSNNFPAGTAFSNLTFNSGAGSFVLIGDGVSLTGNITDNQATSTVMRIGFDLAPTPTPFVNVANNGTLSITGAISGPFGVTKTGPGA